MGNCCILVPIGLIICIEDNYPNILYFSRRNNIKTATTILEVTFALEKQISYYSQKKYFTIGLVSYLFGESTCMYGISTTQTYTRTSKALTAATHCSLKTVLNQEMLNPCSTECVSN